MYSCIIYNYKFYFIYKKTRICNLVSRIKILRRFLEYDIVSTGTECPNMCRNFSNNDTKGRIY